MKKFKAFSLIELLISLIIISLIVSSFIPIITRKIKHQKIQSFSYNFKTKDCPINCNFCNNKNCIQCKDGYELKDNICISSGEIYCNKFNAIYDKANNICITKYNLGDKGLKINGASIVYYNQICPQGVNGKCCWIGNTTNNCNSNKSAYNGCYRTVCNWMAAKEICKNYTTNQADNNWRLPTQNEIAHWVNNFELISKANMCALQEGGANPWCNLVHGVCKYNDGNIFGALPSNIWSDMNNPNNSAWGFYLEKNSSGINSGDNIFNARSVRCVKNIE